MNYSRLTRWLLGRRLWGRRYIGTCTRSHHLAILTSGQGTYCLRHRLLSGQRRRGRVVLWGSAYRLDVQCGSCRDRALARHYASEAAGDRAWRELGERSLRTMAELR